MKGRHSATPDDVTIARARTALGRDAAPDQVAKLRRRMLDGLRTFTVAEQGRDPYTVEAHDAVIRAGGALTFTRVDVTDSGAPALRIVIALAPGTWRWFLEVVKRD